MKFIENMLGTSGTFWIWVGLRMSKKSWPILCNYYIKLVKTYWTYSKCFFFFNLSCVKKAYKWCFLRINNGKNYWLLHPSSDKPSHCKNRGKLCKGTILIRAVDLSSFFGRILHTSPEYYCRLSYFKYKFKYKNGQVLFKNKIDVFPQSDILSFFKILIRLREATKTVIFLVAWSLRKTTFLKLYKLYEWM